MSSLLLGPALDTLDPRLLLDAMFDLGIADAVVVTDVAGNIVRMNRVAQRLIGRSLDSMLGRAFADVVRIVHADTRAPIERFVQRILNEESSGDLFANALLIASNATEHALAGSGSLLQDVDGSLRGAVLVLHDKSVDAEAERRLRESRQRLLQVQRVAGMGFWDWDLRSQQIIASEEVYKICGIEPQFGAETPELIGRVVHPEDVPRVQASLEGAIAGINDFDVDVRVVRPSGEIRWVNTAAALTRDDDGQPASLLGTLLDVTHRKHVEEVLRGSELRLHLLHDLSEMTRELTEPEEIMPAALRVLGEHLHASRCAFAHVDPEGIGYTIPYDYTDGCRSLVGRHQLPASRLAWRELKQGHTLIVRDVEREVSPEDGALELAALQVRAMIGCAHVRDGKFRALLAVHQTSARDWTSAEIAMVEEVAVRCWATIEQRIAEAKFRRSEALLRIASRTAQIGGFSADLRDGTI
ncbi:MAG TPA: PAS domain-containing protein, partial [Polyangiales bacterium]